MRPEVPFSMPPETDRKLPDRGLDHAADSRASIGFDQTSPAGRTRQRLDVALADRGLVVSRARARDLVRRGEVAIDGVTATKVAMLVGPETRIELAPGAGDYVSRGALKLAAGLDYFGLDVEGLIGLDIGAAQGGFTEVLLARGARRVYAVDNGRDQLVPRLRERSDVVSLEETDARMLTRVLVPEPVGVLVVDVSFISLLKVLPAVLGFAAPGAALLALVKPQFETERRNVGKNGIVRDSAVHAAVQTTIANWIGAQPGWRVLGTMSSPITGGSGNTEFMIGARHGG